MDSLDITVITDLILQHLPSLKMPNDEKKSLKNMLFFNQGVNIQYLLGKYQIPDVMLNLLHQYNNLVFNDRMIIPLGTKYDTVIGKTDEEIEALLNEYASIIGGKFDDEAKNIIEKILRNNKELRIGVDVVETDGNVYELEIDDDDNIKFKAGEIDKIPPTELKGGASPSKRTIKIQIVESSKGTRLADADAKAAAKVAKDAADAIAKAAKAAKDAAREKRNTIIRQLRKKQNQLAHLFFKSGFITGSCTHDKPENLGFDSFENTNIYCKHFYAIYNFINFLNENMGKNTKYVTAAGIFIEVAKDKFNIPDTTPETIPDDKKPLLSSGESFNFEKDKAKAKTLLEDFYKELIAIGNRDVDVDLLPVVEEFIKTKVPTFDAESMTWSEKYWEEKYLKYKSKYLALKEQLNL